MTERFYFAVDENEVSSRIGDSKHCSEKEGRWRKSGILCSLYSDARFLMLLNAKNYPGKRKLLSTLNSVNNRSLNHFHNIYSIFYQFYFISISRQNVLFICGKTKIVCETRDSGPWENVENETCKRGKKKNELI